MENHPIPQDVTGFQFKLIGNMTLKQFAYVAFGVIASVVLYYLPVNIFIKIIFIPLLGGGGILAAFLPVEGRPLDVMFGNFIKSIFSPNQYVYQKTGRQFGFTGPSYTKISSPRIDPQPQIPQQNKQQQIQSLIQNTAPVNKNALDEKEELFLKTLSTRQKPIIKQLEEAKSTVDKPKTETIENQMQALHLQRQQLDEQLQQLKAQLVPAQAEPQQYVRSIPQDMLKTAGFSHISDTPNVITGIVKDSRGNVLSGMLVEVKDKQGNPVRAFKTNQLGQFISATPLALGTYTIELEDPKRQHTFDAIQIVANNQIILPIEIISHDAREELRKELFN